MKATIFINGKKFKSVDLSFDATNMMGNHYFSNPEKCLRWVMNFLEKYQENLKKKENPIIIEVNCLMPNRWKSLMFYRYKQLNKFAKDFGLKIKNKGGKK